MSTFNSPLEIATSHKHLRTKNNEFIIAHFINKAKNIVKIINKNFKLLTKSLKCQKYLH